MAYWGANLSPRFPESGGKRALCGLMTWGQYEPGKKAGHGIALVPRNSEMVKRITTITCEILPKFCGIATLFPTFLLLFGCFLLMYLFISSIYTRHYQTCSMSLGLCAARGRSGLLRRVGVSGQQQKHRPGADSSYCFINTLQCCDTNKDDSEGNR